MNELYLLLLGFLGAVAAGCSIALHALGKLIDRFPAGDESKRTRSISSPVESTTLSIVLYWVLFVIGGWAVQQDSRIVMIAGITILFAISLFLFTALVFSFAVLNAMRARRKEITIPAGMPVVQVSPTAPAPVAVPQAEPAPPAPVIRKRYNNPVTDFMLNALLKKD